MRTAWMTIGSFFLACSCAASDDEVGTAVAANELGVASLTTDSYRENGSTIFELRALDEHGNEVATFRRSVGSIPDLPRVPDADFDDTLGTEFVVEIGEEKVRTITRIAEVTRLPRMYGYPQATELLRLPEVRKVLEREAKLTVDMRATTTGPESAYSSYTMQTPLANLRPVSPDGNTLVSESPCTTVWVDPIAPIPSGTMINSMFIKPSTEQLISRDMYGGKRCVTQSGSSACSGTACFYGPCGGSASYISNKPSSSYYWYIYTMDLGYENGGPQCWNASSTNRYHANAYGNVTGTCQYKGCCNGTPTNSTVCGGGSGIGYWEY
jgi:hypothetical protein